MLKSTIGKSSPPLIHLLSSPRKGVKGHLRILETSQLSSLFIHKIMQAKPVGVDIDEWIELIFGLHERFIVQYESNRAFTMLGFYKPVPHVRMSGLTKGRIVKQGKRVWVRFDKKYSNVIDIEAPIGETRGEPKLFQLSLEEWNKIKMWLIPTNPIYQKLHDKTKEFLR